MGSELTRVSGNRDAFVGGETVGILDRWDGSVRVDLQVPRLLMFPEGDIDLAVLMVDLDQIEDHPSEHGGRR